MPLYAYQAMDKAGAFSAGKVDAENEEMVAARLKRMGFMPLEINAIKKTFFPLSVKHKVSTGDLALFSRQLAAMLNAGIPLTRCLFALGEQAANPGLAAVLTDIGRSVEGGMSFSESMRPHAEVFSEMYVDLINAGEVGGTLEEVLLRLSRQLDSDKILKDSIRSAMFYPMVVLSFAFLILAAMLIFIVPVFMGFYPPGAELPLLTALIIAVSNSVRAFWYIYLLVFFLLALVSKNFFNTKKGRYLWDKTKLSLPVFGSLAKKTVLARFARTFSTLLAGGIPVLQALDTAGPASGNVLVAEAVKKAGEKVQEGQSIAAPLKESHLFPPMVVLMVSVGEESGDLPSLLTKLADFYEAEVAAMTKGLTSMIEPLMLIIVGAIVAVMVISLYLPMFSVITQIQ